MKIAIEVETKVSTSVRAKQVSSMFDLPPQEVAKLRWDGDCPIEEHPWNVGLIVGPSGAGKSTILNRAFGEPTQFEWNGASVVDDFGMDMSVQDVTSICGAVGFNTIPAWLRPYRVLSNGERFRVDLARRLAQAPRPIVCDEFTSVVDRQVAKIGAHAAQKYIRAKGLQFVAAACHYDLEDWLQPDWVLEPADMSFRWRSVQRRPPMACTIARVPYSAWGLFSRFHYLTADLHRAARCYCLFVDGAPAAFCAAVFRSHPKVHDVYGLSRGVVLPDYQGLGLIFALIDRIGAVYRAKNLRIMSYPAHPMYIRSHDRSPNWRLERKPGFQNSNKIARAGRNDHQFGGRPCAVFAYVGPAASPEDADAIFGPGDRPEGVAA